MDYRTLLLARAYAKVNLTLSVGPPEPPGAPREGMHPIASWITCIELHDDLSFSRLLPGDQSRYQIVAEPDAPRPDPINWPPEEDLAVRAHQLLEREARRPLPVRITLRKRIPAGTGLGGGSSDAAATLMSLNRMFGLGLSAERLATLSLELGSDVGFFIDEQLLDHIGAEHAAPRPALVGGFGERVQRLAPLQVPSMVLVIPPFSCSTAKVYARHDQLGGSTLRTQDVQALAAEPTPDPARLFNDLAPAVESLEPRLINLRSRIAELTRFPVHMSGSGSALFLLGAGAQHAAAIRNDLPGVAAFVTRPI